MPDLTLDKWEYNGSTTLKSGRHSGKDADAWVWVLREDLGYGEYVNVYTFYVDKVRCSMIHACLLLDISLHLFSSCAHFVSLTLLSMYVCPDLTCSFLHM
jgi:hypothetical protein